MGNGNILLLDCTLRDGGYVNNWKWGFRGARAIIQTLTKSNVDIVEVGFLRNVDEYDPDITVCNHIEELNRLLPEDKGNTIYSAMAMRSNYDIRKLSPYSGSGIEMIRITAHDYDINEGMEFAAEVKDKGYKLSINPINIMGYSDSGVLWIIEQVNRIQPYQFSIVDTFGSMKRRDLDRIVSLVDHNLDKNIRVALHLHENMSNSYSLAQNFIDRHLNRPVTVDGSLMGMGRIPGNLPIELIADYLNDYAGKNYDIDYMMDAIQSYIAPLKGETEWGYTPAYFLSARHNLHRNYSEHYLKKGDLTNRDIHRILSRIDASKKTAFDATYADRLYEDYKNFKVDDADSVRSLKENLEGRNVLIVAPGPTFKTEIDTIREYIELETPVVISVNFIPDELKPDIAFFGNNKRFDSDSLDLSGKIIITSNLLASDHSGEADYVVDYNSLSGSFHQGNNSLLMLLKLLRTISVDSVSIAGADGYYDKTQNYYEPTMRNTAPAGNSYNVEVAAAINRLGIKVRFITPSAYEALMRIEE